MEVDYDILSLVSQSLARLRWFKDVSRMAQTCRFLHLECTFLLLTPRHLRVAGDVRIESFCRFMLADQRQRVPLLSRCHSLQFVTGDAFPESVADLLIETLRHITTFPQFIRFVGFEFLMGSSPRIFPALASIPWIYRLEINSFGSTMLGKRFYAKFLKTLQAPLKAVRLFLPHSGGKDKHVSYNRELDPLWLLSSFSPTLESILLVGAVTVSASSVIHVYPRLTHLTIPKHCMPVVRPYIDAFPSLRALDFDYSFFCSHWGGAFTPTQGLPTETLRDKASEELRRHNREDQFARGSWRALEYFMAITLDAYMAGLMCRIPSLHLVAWGGTMDAEISAICDIFADARPSLFRLALRPAQVDYLAALFYDRVEIFSSLSSLELRVDVAAVPFDFKSYLDTVGTALQRLPIISLQVEIKCLAHIATRPPNEPRFCEEDFNWAGPAGPRCYTLAGMAVVDVQAILRFFLEQVPTLRRVTLAWGRCVLDKPHRLVTIDLDSIPHTVDRPGQPTDQHWRDGYHNSNYL